MDIARTLRTVARSSVAAWDAPADRKAALLAECDRAAHAVAAVADACAKGDLFPWEVADAARGLLGALALLNGDNPTGREGEMVDARAVIGCPLHVQRCAETVRRVADGWLTSRKATHGEMPRQRCLSGPMRSFMVREEPEAEQRIRRHVASEAASVDWYHVTERMERGPYGSTEITVRVVVPWSAEGEPTGDAGGPGDSLIAQAARGVTGETDPLKVAKQIASMMPAAWADAMRRKVNEIGQRDADYRQALADVCEALGVSSSRTPVENLPGLIAERMGTSKTRSPAPDDAAVNIAAARAEVNAARAALTSLGVEP